MKYWLFQSNQVLGPFDRDELASTAGFSPESLVCPEGRKGTQMGDWQRAGVVSELAETLLRMARVPAAAGGPSGGSFLPPEPTLRDLAVLGTLQEKVALLENSLSSLHEELREREEESQALKVELSQKSAEAAELQSKVADLEVRLSGADALKEDLAKTKEFQQNETKTVEDLRTQLDSVRAELQSSVGRMEETQEKLREDLSGRIAKVKEEAASSVRAAPAPAPRPNAAPAPAPKPAPASAIPDATPFELPVPGEPPSLGAPAGLQPPSFAAPGGEPAPMDFGSPALELGGGPTPAPVPLDSPPPFDLEAPPGAPPSFDAAAPGSVPPPLDLPGGADFGRYPTPLPSVAPGPAPLFGPDTPAPGAASDGPVDLMAPEAKPKRGKKVLVIVALLAVVGGLGGAYQMGILNPYLKQFGLLKGPAPAAPVQSAEPAPEPAAPVDDVSQGKPDLSQDAVEFAKAYPIPRLGKSLAAVLEPTASGAGLVSPWNVKPAGDGRWEVSFYGKPGRLDYSYEVRLEAKEVRGLNAKSQAVLDGKAPAAAKPEKPAAARPRKPRHSAPAEEDGTASKAAAKALSDDPLGSLLLQGSTQDSEEAVPPTPRRDRRRPAQAAPAEEPAPSEDAAASEEEAPAPKRKAAAAKSKDELTLDELLLPGVPKNR
ncbi:MAG: hypothetical protein HY928_08315 [Elusimicrobia bacterium]|nr:hypothetical protein [Elusimicrobiota bacterium]